MKIDLNKQFTRLSGEPYQGEASHMGKVLAEALSMLNKGQSAKLYSWAVKLYNKEVLEIDETDHDVLIGLIETTDKLNILCKAQLLLELPKDSDSTKKIKKP